jgi:hypothetical protein
MHPFVMVSDYRTKLPIYIQYSSMFPMTITFSIATASQKHLGAEEDQDSMEPCKRGQGAFHGAP